MWPVLFCVNSLYFQQWNPNWDIVFWNSCLDSKLGFLDVGLRLTSVFFLIYKKKIENLQFVSVALVGLLNFSRIHETDDILIVEC